MTGRSTSMPRIAIGAGVVAAATLIHAADKGASASSVGNVVADHVAFATSWRGSNLGSAEDAVADNSLHFPVDEEWSQEKHMPELRKLIVKDATSKAGLSAQDARRLAVLQRMRREALPLAMSYESFMRESERIADLKRLTDALMAYEHKYGHASNGQEEA